ncbi:carbohydrate ABC transporter permease [Alicyclobacillus fastidiosus]|uniref:carbohydrate ABC transporter permease n=1 Tax=Alicyclobacillus fastidiosus TaxID=392011 RepID=UPI0024E08733|nr:sugar ABC transporter permease [Alicyclobacillus fastidiosus]
MDTSFVAGRESPVASLSGCRRARKDFLVAVAFLIPAFAFLIIFVYFPTVLAVLLAFIHFQIGVSGSTWVGLSNFKEAVTDAVFQRSIVHTLYYAAMVVPATLILATAIALLINRATKFYSFIRVFVLLPYVTPAIGTAIGWMWIYDPTYGLANAVLHWLHLPMLQWLQSPYLALPSIAIYSLWHGVGFDVVIMLSALSGLPSGVLEASLVDGASPWRRFWRITLPLISPTMFFLVIVTTIGSLQAFSQVFALSSATGGQKTRLRLHYLISTRQLLHMGIFLTHQRWLSFWLS